MDKKIKRIQITLTEDTDKELMEWLKNQEKIMKPATMAKVALYEKFERAKSGLTTVVQAVTPSVVQSPTVTVTDANKEDSNTNNDTGKNKRKKANDGNADKEFQMKSAQSFMGFLNSKKNNDSESKTV